LSVTHDPRVTLRQVFNRFSLKIFFLLLLEPEKLLWQRVMPLNGVAVSPDLL